MAILSPKLLDLESETLISSKQEIYAIVRNNLNGFWDFYNGPNMVLMHPRPNGNPLEQAVLSRKTLSHGGSGCVPRCNMGGLQAR